MIVGFDKPLRYHLDSNAVDILSIHVGSVYILIWKLVVSSDMLEVRNRVPPIEQTWVVVIWVTVICLLLYIVAKLYQKVGDLDEGYGGIIESNMIDV